MTLPLGIVGSSVTFSEFVILSGTSSVTSDATYYYRRFNANATFKILNKPLVADILRIGGGAGGATGGTSAGIWYAQEGNRATYYAAGGSAGGIIRESLSTTLYNEGNGALGGPSSTFTVTIGAGGAAGSRRRNHSTNCT
jgi:hypothetical protein